MKNRKSSRSNTGYKGITQRKRSGKFEAFVQFPTNDNGTWKRKQVGTYDDLKTAKTERKNFIKNLL